jgi:hypothetical protein
VPTIKFSAVKGIRRRQIVDALSLIKTRMISKGFLSEAR